MYKKLEEQQVSASFKKREFVLETMDGQYPQLVKFQVLQDKVSLLENCQEGDTIKVTFDLSGREYNSPKGETLYFTNLNCWRLEKVGAGNAKSNASNSSFENAPFPSSNDAPPASGGQDDLPF